MNTNSFKSEIESLVEERRAKYKTTDNRFDCEEITATFNREKETVNGYNGRQLLELIQNADDAKSEKILIKLDTNQRTLIIANKGKNCEGFSIAGVKSLLLANLSSKTSNECIGNKGLGFRSIINWSDKITINSNNLDIAFSKKIAVEAFVGSGLEHSKLPILAIPEIKDNQPDNWKTKITLEYKEKFLDDIKKQIEQIKPEILLFLNHLENITLIIDEEENDHNKPDLWTIESKNGDIPSDLLTEDDEDAKYELKIAFNESLTNNGFEYLFSYFPTNIEISMPFIVHGTFDLDSTRNQLNNTEKNKFVLRELVKLIINTAKNLTAGTANYKALEFLNYSHKNEVLKKLGFYEEIDLAIDKLEIYPCLGGDYRKKEDILYSNDFSKFVNTDDYRELFPYLLIPADSEKIIGILNDQKLDGFSYYNNQIEGLKSLNERIFNTDDRVEFIHLLIKNDFEGRLSLLIDSDNELIFENEVYTPSNHEFSLPDFVKIKFINQELFDKLIEKFEVTGGKAGELQKILKDITNIHGYESAPVLQKIITQSNEEVKNRPQESQEIIIEMVQSLYKNYQILKSTPPISENIEIELISKGGTLSKSRDLYLSKSYPSGELTEFLFSGVFKDRQFLANTSLYRLQDENAETVEQFFLWLGVNKISKLVPALYSDRKEYCELLFSDVSGKPDYAVSMELNGLVNMIDNFNKIAKNISLEKFILWCIKDTNINENFGKGQSVNLLGSKGGYINTRSCYLSYIEYQLYALNLAKDYLIGDEKINKLINNKVFDFNYEKFKDLEIAKYDIEKMLKRVSAVDKFDKLPVNAVSRIVRDLPNKSENGKQAETIYKLCLKHFEKNQKTLVPGKYKVFATKNNQDGYFDTDKVFYNGSIKLPKKIAQARAIFKYPKRQNTENIINFFGLKDLKSIKINVIKSVKIEDKTAEFNAIFEKIKPYILAYRINKIESEENQQKEVNKLNKINIELCKNIEYQIDGEKFILDKSDYIKDNEKYLIEASKDIDLSRLKCDFDFQEGFADIIGLEFGIVETQNFGKMLNEEIEYIEKETQVYLGNDIIIQAKELLGISDEFNSFWRAIYGLKNIEYSELLKNDFSKIQDDLNISIDENSLNYEDLNNIKNLECIADLFNKLEIEVNQFNQKAYYKIDFSNYHQQKLEICFDDNLYQFKQNLYKYCSENNQHSDFLKKLNQYQAPKRKSNHIVELEVNYQNECNVFVDTLGFKFGKTKEIDFDKIFFKNKKQLGGDFDYIENNNEIKSLLYFEEQNDKVKEYILAQNQPQERIASQENHSKPKKISEAELMTPTSNKKNGNSSNFTQSNYQQNYNKKRAGDSAEQEVYDALIEKYGKEKVNWVSRDNPSADHDFKYKDDNKWWFVEVKTLTNNIRPLH
ncbi:sacsin N-terminal ATP-binding-like domain-containing protein [Bathymodiolus thermophilus thioautotrophic gill symbiont]|uniref:Protein NO VEIN C-terminal domain-containing protein n=1 Tax=Bathymodiolus thermophilus thioautotrophic gill symbiont TaxID=2360 RepID=A0A8H9CFM7_9GAMM|nr:ATP-binding protein [Bathymodiolus thermophilus thioautotrophic gill symbiont]CAB5499864.1 hypothetical protein THERMOS_1106 [Bathymodiolus thermophilus thioautotrophic gill symbiont]